MKQLVAITIALLGLASSTGCTPEQIDLFLSSTPEVQSRILVALQPPDDPFHDSISPDGLARLRACESGGNYQSIGGGGSFRGAYQFTRSTWNATAGRFYPHLSGVDPASADPGDQDRMARALWANGGPRHWPVCSRRV